MRQPQALTFASDDEEVIVDKVEPNTTFFYMGLDIPVKNTEAIQRFKQCEETFRMNKLDFTTRLQAATDKVIAFKDFFYGKEPNFMRVHSKIND